MASQLPTVDEVRQLPVVETVTVPSSYIDANGHMNIRHYLDHGAEGAGHIVLAAGVDDAYRATRRMGVFTVEHHLKYVGELREGEEFTVHTRVLARTPKVLHLMSFIVNATRDQLANVLEIALLHVDMDHRRAMAFPDDVATALDTLLATHTVLPWSAPVTGVMGPRH